MKKLLTIVDVGWKIAVTVAIIILLVMALKGPSFGGTTHFTNISAQDVTATDDLSVADDATITDSLTVTGNTGLDGGLIVGGRYNYGETASMTLDANVICDYNLIQIDGDGDAAHDPDYNTGVSLSFPDDETLIADCMGTVGDYKQFIIDPTSSTSTTYIDIVETGNIMEFGATSAQADVHGGMMIRVEVFNTGTSLSWYFDAIDASVSYQP